MSTTIHSLGSKWYGEEADPIETLFKVLAEHPLSRVFEAYGNFIGPREDGRARRPRRGARATASAACPG